MLPTLHFSLTPHFFTDQSFITDSVIDHDDSIDTDVHATAMCTVVDGGFVHDAEPHLEFE